MTQQPYQPKPQKRSPIVTILIVIAVIVVGGFILGKTAFPTTPSAPITVTPTASADADFGLAVDDYLAKGTTYGDATKYGNAVCEELASGSSEKAIAKEVEGSPWLVAGSGADFVSTAHDMLCPEV